MTAQVIERQKLGVLTKIGQGGQGVVYGAPHVKTKFAPSMVYKEYKAQTRAEIDFTALAAMPALVEESLSYAQAERLVSIAAWPCALVEEGGTPTGFVMPAIPDEFFISLATVKGVSPATAEFQHLLNHPSVLAARGIGIDEAQRYSVLREVASGLAFLHKHGVCVGDISPKNLLFSLTPREAVYFIDCDAMRINDVSALTQVETPGWAAPSGEELATIYSDTYKLGLLALRLMTGDHDTTNPEHLPATTPAMLRQIVTDTLTNAPHQRPLPEAWTYVLGYAIEQAQHRKKLTASPVSAAPTPPPIPEVRSRPTVHSGPAASPSVHPKPPVRPSAPPQIEETLSPGADRQRRRLKWPLIAAMVVVVAAAAGVTGYLLRQPSTDSQPSATSTATTTPTGPRPVTEAALDGLLLSPDQINTVMGTTGMTVRADWDQMSIVRDNDIVADKNCQPLAGAASQTAYAGRALGSARSQQLVDKEAWEFLVTQAVVLFPSAHDASDFFTASAQQWPTCSKFTQSLSHYTEVDTVGPVSNVNGVLSANIMLGDGGVDSCQRALTVVNNVVVDIDACIASNNVRLPAGSAVTIARQIAGKIPTT
ncbi:sensor domain-containing protein [Mycobacterium sp. E3198]|uniref:sensor domain-containing protein n=1 Tax=Mycobacterium sp. E3198 TaxID=1834143 RepID=UPI0009ED8C35|nr:sensor domain-containing protein [Mycobacterium sp. E3198]